MKKILLLAFLLLSVAGSQALDYVAKTDFRMLVGIPKWEFFQVKKGKALVDVHKDKYQHRTYFSMSSKLGLMTQYGTYNWEFDFHVKSGQLALVPQTNLIK